MHEASLCDALFDQVDTSIVAHPDARVREIHVAIGALAGVDPELFQIAFDTLRDDRHPRAVLIATHVPATWRCPNCPTCNDFHLPNTPLTCPSCESPLTLTAGGDLTLLRIELELPNPQEISHV